LIRADPISVTPPLSGQVSPVAALCASLSQAGLGTVLASTLLPFCDEGFYGVPAHLLSVTGTLRNPVLESAGIPCLRGVETACCWMAPMGMVFQSGAFRLFGFGLPVQREPSVVCGVGSVLFWYLALRRLVSDRIAALASYIVLDPSWSVTQ
jgi:hypothetical protein